LKKLPTDQRKEDPALFCGFGQNVTLIFHNFGWFVNPFYSEYASTQSPTDAPGSFEADCKQDILQKALPV
jgi:hypothetical protein